MLCVRAVFVQADKDRLHHDNLQKKLDALTSELAASQEALAAALDKACEAEVGRIAANAARAALTVQVASLRARLNSRRPPPRLPTQDARR